MVDADSAIVAENIMEKTIDSEENLMSSETAEVLSVSQETDNTEVVTAEDGNSNNEPEMNV